MASKKDLVDALGEGKVNALTGTDLEETLGMPVGNTNEPTRGLIADCILNEKYPIGSNSHGYFLIDSDEELDEVVNSMQSRIDGIEARIDALKNGWARRKSSKQNGENWPK
jgi:hypothetical protein